MVAGPAWLAGIAQARGMSAVGGTMSLGLFVFIPVWTLMMAAMMLPSVAPVAVLYERSIARNRIARRHAPSPSTRQSSAPCESWNYCGLM